MADPVKKPLTWSKSYPTYAERHEMFRVFQEVLKELVIIKPLDPLAFIRDEITKIADQLNAPRVFLLGPNVTTQGIGRHMAQATGSRFLTLADVIEAAPLSIRGILAAYVEVDQPDEHFDESIRKLLIATIMQRVRCADCQKNGYILYGFPQDKAQALCAQQSGLLPRQVFILMPESVDSLKNTSKSSKPTVTSDHLSSSTTGHSTNATYISPVSQHTNSGGTHQTTESHPAPPSIDFVIKSEDGTLTKVSSHVRFPEADQVKLKEIADAYDYEICKIIPHDKWFSTKKTDIEGELLSHIVSIKPCGAPWIPRILVMGPPFSGKSTVAEQLSAKFGFVDVDFIDCIRGASLLLDEVGKACKKYLRDLNPLNDAIVKILLQRRLLREDCERKGWILHGFPDTMRQLTLLDILEISPNRVFYMACSEEVCWSRLQQKRQEVLDRKLKGAEDKVLQMVDENDFDDFPYGRLCFRNRTDLFMENFDAISSNFGKNMIFVDATGRKQRVFEFMQAAVLRPPVIRYQEQD